MNNRVATIISTVLTSRLSSVTSLQCLIYSASPRNGSHLQLGQQRRKLSSTIGNVAESEEVTDYFDEDALVTKFFAAAKRNDVAAAEDIIESENFSRLKESVNLTDALGNSPLMICAQRNWSESISLLLANDHCDVNHQNMFGSSALMCSSSHGHLDALKVLLESKKVEVDLVSRFGQTALMKAAQAGKLTSIKVLLENGANVAIINKQGKGALQIAEEKSHKSVVNFLTCQMPIDREL